MQLLANHSLFRVVRLRVELEILKPRPVKDNSRDPSTKEKINSEYAAELKKWKREIRDELRSLAYTPDHERPTITLPNTFAFYKAEDEIRNYLRFLFHFAAAPLTKPERGRFFCQVKIPDGYLMPLHLVTGLLAHFEDDWKHILDQYDSSEGDFRPMVNRFIMDTWLLWGPSIPLCTCNLWQGGIAMQFGYGDENNSLPVFIPYSKRNSVLGKLEMERATADLIPKPHRPALGSRVVFTGVPIWCESMDEGELARAQSSLLDSDESGLLLEYVTHAEKGSLGSNDSSGYYSAYIWLMLEVTESSRWPEGIPPSDPWQRLIPIYEHANLFDEGAFTFFKERLAEKTIRFLEQAQENDSRFRCRLVCAIDETGCASKPIHSFPGFTISHYLRMILERKEHEDLRKRVNPDAPLGGSDLSACHVPGWVSRFKREIGRKEVSRPAGLEFEAHEFQASRADLSLLSKLYKHLYEKEFPDPDERESLKNIVAYLVKKRSGWYGRNNYHVLALLDQGNPVAVSICDYFAEPNAGVIEFLAIHPAWRKQGVGTKIGDAFIAHGETHAGGGRCQCGSPLGDGRVHQGRRTKGGYQGLYALGHADRET
ncbi:MAG: GNAT family N-acetyltransferase [Fibrobacteres bacterium]|nr:GNAT family N-acetyltransferase [Fibrobacterota bacterium]